MTQRLGSMYSPRAARAALIVPLVFACVAVMADDLTVFKARSIITMDETLPRADAVAVAGGRIVAVGSVESMSGWLGARDHVVDTRFEDLVLVPGLIDNHLHPFLGAMLLNTDWITPHEWDLPGLRVPRTRGRDAYVRRLEAALAESADTSDPFITWGYHEIWHGPITRPDLDRLSRERPIVVWQRSFHEVIVNTAGLAWLGIDPGAPSPHHEIDLAAGRFSERGLLVALGPIGAHLLAPERIEPGLARLGDVIRRGGITTIGDMGAGGYLGFEKEFAVQQAAFGGDDTPFRVVLVPAAIETNPAGGIGALADAFDGYAALATDRIRVGRHVKLLADGAFFAQYMRMNPPGYIDGHEGKWLTEPADLLALAREFWGRGFQLHVHVNGDAGLDAVLDILAELLDERPRVDHRLTLHHVGYSSNDQLRRAARLGVAVSAQPYYLWALADAYAEHGLGYDRASQISRIGGMLRNGIPVSLHSDFTMAPAAPLTLAWVAVNRLTADGTLMAREERISVKQALRAITIDAAFALRMEHEIGSIVAGKRADFTVLEADPLEIAPQKLKDIPIWGTVYEGTVYPISRQ